MLVIDASELLEEGLSELDVQLNSSRPETRKTT